MSIGTAEMTDGRNSQQRKGDKTSHKRKRTEASNLDDTTPSRKKPRREPSPAASPRMSPGNSQEPLEDLTSDPDEPQTLSGAEPTGQDKMVSTTRADHADTPFVQQRTSLYLPLSPISQAKPLEGLCAEHLSPHIMSYYPPLKGVLLAYSNASLSNLPSTYHKDATVYAKSIDEYAFSYAWVVADFLVFRPERGTWIEGYVMLQNENHLSLLCYNQFNASIERRHMPREWKWSGASATSGSKLARKVRSGSVANEEAEGTFVDGEGNKIDGLVRFRVVDFEGAGSASGNKAESYLLIEGSLLSEEETRLKREEQAREARNGAPSKAAKGKKASKTRKPAAQMDDDDS